MIDPETGEKVKTELRDIRLEHIAFADRPAIREGYAIVKNLDNGTFEASEAPSAEPSSETSPETVVQKAEEVVVTEPEAGPAVATPAHDALLAEKIAVLEKQISDMVALLKSGGYSYTVWEKWWNAYDMLHALCPEANVIAMAKTERDPEVSFEKALDNMLVMLGAMTEAKTASATVEVQKTENTGEPRVKAFTADLAKSLVEGLGVVQKVVAQVGPDGLTAVLDLLKVETPASEEPDPDPVALLKTETNQKLAEQEGRLAALQKTLDIERSRYAELQAKLEKIDGTARSSALPTESATTSVKKTDDVWSGVKLF